MADDLDSFFAKKAAKKSKKSLAQDTDSLARRLEKAVRQQEQFDRNCEEEERVMKDRIQAVESQHTEAEDSDWLDVQQEVEICLATGGLKELNIEEIEEDNKSVNEERVEKTKTWNMVKAKEEEEAKVVVEEKKPEQSQIYIAPRRMIAAKSEIKEPDLQDASEFPSLEAAENISKKEMEKKKLKALQEKEFIEQEKEKLTRRQRELELEKESECKRQKDTNAWRNKPLVENSNDQVDKTTPAGAPAQKKYVPPHMRHP